MYNSFYRFFGLRENPFNVNPDPGYLYLTQKTSGVLEEMAGAIQARKGLIVLTGDAGTGKTTLINRIKQWLEKQKTPTAFIFNPHLEINELFDLMLADYGISADPHLKGSSLSRLNQWLLERHRAGHNAVLIVDEAQGLPLQVLEQIRMLLNHEMPDQKLLQVVLSGQPELEDKLNRADMRQLRQRINLRCHTAALKLEEARAYVQRRLQIAGGTEREVFTPEAVEMIHLYSRGIPRVMNLLCEHGMIRGFVSQMQPVPASTIEAVARALQFDDVKPVGARSNSEAFFSSPPPSDYSVAQAAKRALDVLEPVDHAERFERREPVKHLEPAEFAEPLEESAETVRAEHVKMNPAVATELKIELEPGLPIELEPELVIEPEIDPEIDPEQQPSVAAPIESKAEAPALTWFEATLGAGADGAEDESSEDFASEPETQPKPAIVSEFRSLHAGEEESGALFAAEPESFTSDELPLAQPQLVKKPIEITSAAKKHGSSPVVKPANKTQDYLQEYLSDVFARASNGACDAWDKLVAFARSPEWERNFNALVRWLQQPPPTVKVHRRAGH